MREDFLPVILGSDWNVYGVAASFHKEYGIKSAALCMRQQMYTNNLDFLEMHQYENFDCHEVFVEKLLEFSNDNKDKKLLLISCSDYYTGLIIESKKELQDHYYFSYIDSDMRSKLENKMDFYDICQEYDLAYPKTFIVSKDNYSNLDLPFEYPVISKPNDSSKWFKMRFEGYKKAYKLYDKDELYTTLELAYTNGYDDYMIIQDFIPGGPESMFVVNAYVNQHGKVTMTHGAQTALDEVLPSDIGNYNALISGNYPSLTDNVKSFLEKIDYRGYANFDFKYDERDDKFKVFEINLRQGRSSMYMTYAGNNFVKYLVDDIIDEIDGDYYNHTSEHLWYLTSKSVLKKYCPEVLKEKVNRLLKEGKADFGLDYYANANINRFLLAKRRKLSTMKYYPKYAKR